MQRGSGGTLEYRNVQRFRGGLVVKAHKLCLSLNSRLESKKEEEEEGGSGSILESKGGAPLQPPTPVTTSHAAKGSVFVNLRNGGNLTKWRAVGVLWKAREERLHHHPRVSSSSLLLSSLELSDTKVYASKYEPASEPLHISAK